MYPTTISHFKIDRLNLKLTEPFSIASGTQHEAANVLVTIQLSDGTTGLGEAAPFPAVSSETQANTIAALERLKKIVLGKDARNWINIATDIKNIEEGAPAARCAIEMAILDALTKHYNMPLYVFFGGAGISLETDMTIPAGDETHGADSARAIVEKDIKTIKVKTSGADIDFDVKRMVAIHHAAPSAALIVDGNCGYTFESAVLFIDKLSKLKIRPILFEQPLARDNYAGMARLVKETDIPIAADESARSSKDVLQIIQEKCAHVINIKIMKCGIAEALKMIALAQSAGLDLMIGGMVESILSMTFSAHLAAGKGNFKFVDLDTPMFIKDSPFINGFAQKGGLLMLDPARAGHGVELKY